MGSEKAKKNSIKLLQKNQVGAATPFSLLAADLPQPTPLFRDDIKNLLTQKLDEYFSVPLFDEDSYFPASQVPPDDVMCLDVDNDIRLRDSLFVAFRCIPYIQV